MVNTRNIRKSICEIGKLIFDRELTDSSGGNISVRDENKIYINPRRTGQNRQWDLDEDGVIVTDLCKTPITGSIDEVTREAATHYYIYQNFPDIGAVIHGHPIFLMAFGAAHKSLPAVSEGTRAVLGEQPIECTPEVMPGSVEQAEEVVKIFKKRREVDPEAPLLCQLPFHGTFAAGANLNDAFMYTEVANNCAKILVYRKIMFGDDPTADLSIQKHFTKEDFYSIDKSKEVCTPGYVYRDASGKETVYGNGSKADNNGSQSSLIDKITEEVLNKLKGQD